MNLFLISSYFSFSAKNSVESTTKAVKKLTSVKNFVTKHVTVVLLKKA